MTESTQYAFKHSIIASNCSHFRGYSGAGELFGLLTPKVYHSVVPSILLVK
jgi:hypothetical protein